MPQDEKVVELTTDEKFALLTKDIQELARGLNVQAKLLEAIVVASDSIVKKYLELTQVVNAIPAKVVQPTKNEKRPFKK